MSNSVQHYCTVSWYLYFDILYGKRYCSEASHRSPAALESSEGSEPMSQGFGVELHLPRRAFQRSRDAW